nr:hypothetical protein CFP56_24125 [Quercus suber]
MACMACPRLIWDVSLCSDLDRGATRDVSRRADSREDSGLPDEKESLSARMVETEWLEYSKASRPRSNAGPSSFASRYAAPGHGEREHTMQSVGSHLAKT